jgi:hypothetical protein
MQIISSTLLIPCSTHGIEFGDKFFFLSLSTEFLACR